MNFLIVDDHAMIRSGVRRLIEEAYVSADVTEAANGEEALARLAGTAFDLITLDLSMPGLSGLEMLERIARVRPGQRVLVLSMHAEREFAVRCLDAGAAGYITKERGPDELLSAFARIMSGKRYVSPDLAEALVDRSAASQATPAHARLSTREFLVLRLLAQGLSNADIAERLFLSPKTVSTYRTRILEKLELTNNIELARYCSQHGLVD